MRSADTRHILTINAGSSSIKFALFALERPLRLIAKGSLDQGGGDRGHGSALEQLLQWAETHGTRAQLAAIAHRIVHGGPRYSAPTLIDAQMIAALRAYSALDPEHLPQELEFAETLQRQFPELPQVACFDTAFHHEMPRVAQLLPIPRRYQARGLRRYGFHGLSYAYLMQQLPAVAGQEAAQGRIVLAHLGSGASLAAVRGGKPLDTSMGFTPAAGVPMSTRSGDLDPGIAGYLARTEGLDAMGFNVLVNTECGLLGLSETSPDMRALLALESSDVRAQEAVAVFCYQVKKWIGAFAAALGGLDTLVFAGGIGERSAPVRARACAGLEFLGLQLDAARNAAHEPLISSAASRVAVRIIPTDEEQMMARLTLGLLWPEPSR